MKAENAYNLEMKFQQTDLEIKSLDEDGTFEGYASVFGQLDGGLDIVKKGAFKKSIKEKKAAGIAMLWQHDPYEPIGKWIQLKEDNKGLWVKGQFLTTIQRGAEAAELVKAGILTGMSIGYRTVKAMRDETSDTRTLIELDLWEISMVTFPMLKSARVAGKKDWSKEELGLILHNAGVPMTMAERLIEGGLKSADTVDAGDVGEDGELADILRNATQTMQGILT